MSILQTPGLPAPGLHPNEFLTRLSQSYEAYSSLNPATRLYAIVDARSLPDLRSALARLDAVAFEALWDGTALAAHKDLSPLLVAVDMPGPASGDAPHPLVARLRRLSVEAFAVTWVWSPYSLEDLTSHFRSFCEYTLPDRRAFYLHFYDNRILERLRQVWTEGAQERFAGLALDLWYRSRDGADRTWPREVLAPFPMEETALHMTEAQHLSLLALGYADKLALQLRRLLGGDLDHLSQDGLYRAVSVQLERAAAYRIQSDDDMLKYIARALLTSPRFDEHPSVQPLLMAATRGDISFSGALVQADEVLPARTDMDAQ
jgi:hypothetical protein